MTHQKSLIDEKALEAVEDAAFAYFREGKPFPYRKAIEIYEAYKQNHTPEHLEVRRGMVQDVHNVPPGYEYEIKDHDILEMDSSDNGRAA